MLDNKILIRNITKNKKFCINITQPFNKINLEFINNFSLELKKERLTYKYLDLIYLSSWCSKDKILEFKNRYSFKKTQLGRGLVFHISPSNVPTNFVYSFIFGLLSGNSNIVKLPTSEFSEKKIILRIIKNLFKKKKYEKIKNSNHFISYDKNKDNEITEKISSICDGRVIWGGDETINQIRKIWIPERAIEMTFPDRYSFSIINLNKLNNLKNMNFRILIKKFFYDAYTMNQLACNSPHFLFWLGKNNHKLKNKFWNTLNEFVKKRFDLNEKNFINKYTNLVNNMFDQEKFDNLNMFENSLYVIDPNKDLKKIENIRGENGTFFQKNIKSLSNLKNFITKKCQTITYFGLNKKEIEEFVISNNLKGVDRVVPIGNALQMDITWDGFNIVNSLSREVTVQ
tara:strand:- start:922 stop:2121 length:1200 start_codon:yes stop_codon:yes gene_type:complete